MQERHKLSLQVFEVLQRASGLNDDQQAEVFNEYPYPAVAQVLQIYFGDFEYNIPNTPPPGITGASEESHPTNMHKLLRTSGGLAPFIKGAGYDNLNQFQVERRYIQYLEGIHPKDAELVIALFVNDGRFERLYQISQAAAHKAFPGAVPAPISHAIPEAVLPPVEGATPVVIETPIPTIQDQLGEQNVPVESGIVLADFKGPVQFRDIVDAEYDFADLEQHSFEELRRAVMRENHKRKQEAK